MHSIIGISAMSLSALPQRWGASLVVVIGMAGVVAVMISVLAMAQGLERTFANAGRADRVIVLRADDNSGMSSAITREQVPTVLAAPGFARDRDGKPLATVQKFMTSVLPDRKTGAESNILLRGVGDKAWSVWPEVRIIEGRRFAYGKRELIVGRAAQEQFRGLDVGADVEMVNGPWTVVGVFATGGSVLESELWGDAEMVMAGYSISGQFSSVVGLLESDAAFQTLKAALTGTPTLNHTIKRETEFYAEQAGGLARLVRTLGYVVAAIMALGALFAAVNTLYAAVKVRALEIATLRAIGFGALPVVTSVLLESLVLCLAGAVLGSALAYGFFNGYTISTLNAASFSQVAFAFHVSLGLVVQGILWSCAIGLLGGLLPALRAARLPVAEALRAS
jgi:putative ABC transport system permease protein